jgi:hypothetical protein
MADDHMSFSCFVQGFVPAYKKLFVLLVHICKISYSYLLQFSLNMTYIFFAVFRLAVGSYLSEDVE